ncbi:MAG TPA: polysaccharide biosynthesis/export family protein [Blastocatellia bacterium]|nr:polysaccharide biosynthesis/export family protein [Blastocatellia bacterium]
MKIRQILKISKFLTLPLWLGLWTSLTVVAFGQGPPGRSEDSGPRREGREGADSRSRAGGRGNQDVIVSSDEDYQLAPSDVIGVNIEDAPELSGKYRINKSGKIPMKYLGSMEVAGKTPEEVSNLISEGLRGRYLKDPKVYVTVEQYNSRTFFIQGAVKSPGVYVIEGRPSLFKLITIAGGLSENRGSVAYIVRETKVDPEKIERRRAGMEPDSSTDANPAAKSGTPLAQAIEEMKGGKTAIEGESEYEVLTAQIGGLVRGRFEQNMMVEPNDLVYIPPSDVFFVAGEVRTPGQFPLREGTTLRQAMSLAQGTYFKSATSRGIIFRQDPATGKLTEISVDIASIMSGKKEDLPIMPNDVIMIPNSKVKTVGGALLTALGTSMIYRIP